MRVQDVAIEGRAPNLVAPSFMKMSAKRGLALHAEGESGDGLKPATVADARKMVEGTALSEDKWRRIAPWIARHIGDLDAVQGNEITPGLVAMLLWGGGSSKSSARRAQAYAERIVAQLDATEERAPAPKKDQIKGSDKNEPGSAEGKQGGIEISEETETALRNKLDEHNEKQADAPAWKRTTMGVLKSVYRRGAGAFSTSHRPGMTRNQWAMARVNAFLFLVRRGRPENPKYITDNDLLHKDHPKYSGKRYDPDQPREEDGKFGEGGGGGGGNGDDDDEFESSFESAMEAETTVQSKQEEYVKQLDDIQKQAIDEYTGEGYRDVNRFYRGAPPPPLTEDEMEEISFTANMIEASIVEAPPLTEDVTVYRGMTAKALGIEVLEDGDQAFDGLVGSQFTDKGIISTSFSPDVATEFGGSDKVILEIKAPRGTTGLAVGDMSESYMESEFLLPPGTTFNITGVSRMKNQVILEVEAEN